MYSLRTKLSFVLVLICGCGIAQQPLPVAPVAAPDPVRCDVQVYCILGLWNVFSTGLYDLSNALRAVGIPASAVSDTDYQMLANDIVNERLASNDRRPLVLVGHSYGADDCLRVAEIMQKSGLNVDLVILLDSTSPPPVPANIDRCVDYFVPGVLGETLPELMPGHPVSLADGNTHTVLINTPLSPDLGPEYADIGHLTIDKNAALHRQVQLEIQKLCN